MKPNHKYEIQWIDISHSNEWVDFDDINDEITKAEKPIRNIGYFITETPNSYVFSSGINDSGKQYFDLVVYPKQVIKKIRLIK